MSKISFSLIALLLSLGSVAAQAQTTEVAPEPSQTLEAQPVPGLVGESTDVLELGANQVDQAIANPWAESRFDDSLVEVPDLDIVALSPEMKAWVDKQVGDIKTPSSRLKKLVSVIFDPEALNLVYDNSRTKTAIETFDTRNGNCLSFTAMFIGMARHLGLNAYFQEVTNFPTWDKHGDVIVLNRHMNAMVRIDNVPHTLDFNPNAERREQYTRLVSDARAISQFYNNLGAEFYQQGQIGMAIAYFKHATQVDQDVSFNWSNLGVGYLARQQPDLAEECYLKALKINSKEYTAMSNLERLYTRNGDMEKAEIYREQARRFRNKNPYYHMALGDEAYEAGDFATAIDHYRDAIRRKDREHEFYFALARAYYQKGDMEKAKLQMRSALMYSSLVFDQDRYSQKLSLMTAALSK